MDSLAKDLRFGARMLLRNPGMTAAALIVLGLGIGANSAIFSVIHAVLLRPLPIRDADRVVQLAMSSKKLNVTGAQPGLSTYAAWKQHGRFHENIAAGVPGTATASTGGAEESVRLWRVTASFLPTLGVTPVLGRNFAPEEDQPGGARTALLANAYWRSRFSADPRVLGSTVRIDGEPHTVVGVLPPGFHVDGRPADIYTPVAKSLNVREYLPSNIYARLKPGVTIQQAQAEISAYESRRPRGPLGWEIRVWGIRDFQVRNLRQSLWVLLGAVGLVLLIACANTTALLLARASVRGSELAVRTAMGANWRRLMRQLLTESALLGLAGAVCGVLVAMLCVRLVPLLQHERLPGLLEQTRIDGVVLAFTLATALVTALLFGAAPALSAARVDVSETLKEGGRSVRSRRKRGWNALIVTETALAVLLAIGASLLIRTFFFLRDEAPGFAVDNLLTARIAPPRNKFTSREQVLAYWKSIMEKVRAIPGVRAASFAQALPLTGDNWVASTAVEGHPIPARPQDLPTMTQRNVDLEYFRTMRIPLRRGRLFTERDDHSAPKVTIVNEAFVRRFWPKQDGVGKHIGGNGEVPLIEVVGVVGDVPNEDTTKAVIPEVYFPMGQMPTARIALAVRPDPRVYRSALALERAIRQAVAAVDPGQAVTHFAEMQQIISDRIAPQRLSAQLIAIFAGLALVLAAVGIYGVLSFAVAQRTHEIGLRVALGAERSAVVRMVLREAMALAALGVAIGIGAALALTRVMKALLFGVGATAPGLYAASAAILLAIAALAAVLPALRAARVQPVVALRHE